MEFNSILFINSGYLLSVLSNTEGCDYIKGGDIVVVCTPHYNEMVYKLFAAHLGIGVNTKMKFMEIEDECYKYWLHTYEEPDLRKIQLWLLKSELIQAVAEQGF